MPPLDEPEARSRMAKARVATLATVRRDGRPHVVPIVFGVEGETIYSVADPKPKAGLDLLRHRNVAGNPAVSLLVHHYEEPWDDIWWVRADGRARVADDGPDRDAAIRLLRDKYPDYATWSTPFGAAMVIEIERVTSWALGGVAR